MYTAVLAELVAAFLVEVSDGRVFDGPVGAVLDIVPGAGAFEGVSAEELAIGDRLLDQWNGRDLRHRGW